MDYEKKYKEALEKIRDIYYKLIFSARIEDAKLAEKLEEIIPELAESEDELTWLTRFIKEEAYSLSMDIRDNEDRMKLKKLQKSLDWLEKQGEQKSLYIRFGDIPANGKSKIYCGEEEVGYENGVSVYPAFRDTDGRIVLGLSLPITKTTLYTQQNLLEYDNRPCYLVTGDYVGRGSDGEPLISNVNIIEKINNYRVKMEKQGKSASDTRYEVKVGGSLGVNGEPFDYEKATITQKDFAPKVEPRFKIGDWVIDTVTDSVKQIIKVTSNEYICSGHFIISFDNQHLLKKWTIEDAKSGDVLVCPKYAGNTIPNIFIFKDIKRKYNDVFGYCSLLEVFRTEGYIANADSINTDFYPATKEQRNILFQKMREAGYEWNPDKKELKKISQRMISAEAKEALYDKPTWSEEDEKIYQSIIDDTVQENQLDNRQITWLKSLRPQNRWKPSDEQMLALNIAIEMEDGDILKSLYDDLKRLKEE